MAQGRYVIDSYIQMARNSFQSVKRPNENIGDINSSQSGVERAGTYRGRQEKLPCRQDFSAGKGQFITGRLLAIERICVQPSGPRTAVSETSHDRIKKTLKPVNEKSLGTVRPDFSGIGRLAWVRRFRSHLIL